MGTGEEDKDDDLYSDGDNEDSSDDDTAIPGTVATFIGNATAPAGYAIVDVCPPLETNQDLNNFIGKTILVGHDSKQARGWFRGLVHSTGLSAADKRKTPTANFIIKYERGHTYAPLAYDHLYGNISRRCPPELPFGHSDGNAI